MPTRTFGVEFEFDGIYETGLRHRGGGENPPYRGAQGWGAQPEDGSTTYELRSPIWNSLTGASDSIMAEFAGWFEVTDEAPYPYNEGNRSLGQHIHIGYQERPLPRWIKVGLGRHVRTVYPFLAAVHAQPVPSRRGLGITSSYCQSLLHYLPGEPYDDSRDDDSGGSRGGADHFAEISASHLGTVEFRIFDANIPQASMFTAWNLQRIQQHVEADGSGMATGPRWEAEVYRHQREEALTRGLPAISVADYIHALRDMMPEPGDWELDCIREIWYLAAKYGLNPWGVYRLLRPMPYPYFQQMFLEPGQYLLNLRRLASNSQLHENGQLARWVEEAANLRTMDQLIELARTVPATVAEVVAEHVPEITPYIGRSAVAAAIREGRYTINRIAATRYMAVATMADRISRLITAHGEGQTNPMSGDAIQTANERFYALMVTDDFMQISEIAGVIAIRMSTGLISHLVVDRRYRRLGVGERLLQHVLTTTERDRPEHDLSAFVRSGNAASLALFQGQGFERYVEASNGINLVLRRRGRAPGGLEAVARAAQTEARAEVQVAPDMAQAMDAVTIWREFTTDRARRQAAGEELQPIHTAWTEYLHRRRQ